MSTVLLWRRRPARIEALEEENAQLRAALEQVSAMADAAHPRGGKPVPAVVVTLALTSISAVAQAPLEASDV